MTGYVHVYTGNGKGKTTAALGLCLRAAGAGLSVYIGQFMKKGRFSELKALERFDDLITLEQFGRPGFIRGEPTDEDKSLASEGLAKIRLAMQSGRYSLVLMEEINVALHLGIVAIDEVLAILADTLTYAGDEFKWSLPRAQIDNVALGVPVAGIRRIIVRWHVPRGGPRAFSIVCREANTLQALSVVNARLYRALRDWLWRDRPSPSGIPLKWGYPPTDTSGGWTLDRPISGGCISVMAIALIVVLSIWRVSGALLAVEDYYTAVLWAGLIAVVGAVFTGYLLNYLHYWEARKHNR